MSSGTEGNTEGKDGGIDEDDDSSGILLVTFPFLSKGAQRSLESFGSSSSSSSLFHVS